MTFEEARAQFPVLERYAYLNAGSVGPLARATAEAMIDGVWTELTEGRAGRPYFEAALAARERLRAVLAREVGVEPTLVALTNSTTQGCNVVLAGLDLAPEDEIVTTDVEHFGLLGPVHASGARVRVARVRDLPSDRALDTIVAEMSQRTRLIALSHVAWTTGHVLPIEALREAVAAPLLVDGAQSVGAIPVDASPYDFYTVSGQKWLCGPSPTGGLYVRDPDRLRVALPSYLSQSAYEPDGAFEPRPGAARFDPQWIAPGDVRALEAAIAAAPDWRFDRARDITRRCHELVAGSHKVVTEPGHATLLSFQPHGEAEEVARRLVDRGVIVRDLPGTAWVRVSCGWWTSEEDLERLVDGLAD